MTGRKDIAASTSIGEPDHSAVYQVFPAGTLPNIGWIHQRNRNLLTTETIHLLSDDLSQLFDNLDTKGKIGIKAMPKRAYKTSAKQKRKSLALYILRSTSECFTEQMTVSHCSIVASPERGVKQPLT